MNVILFSANKAQQREKEKRKSIGRGDSLNELTSAKGKISGCPEMRERINFQRTYTLPIKTNSRGSLHFPSSEPIIDSMCEIGRPMTSMRLMNCSSASVKMKLSRFF